MDKNLGFALKQVKLVMGPLLDANLFFILLLSYLSFVSSFSSSSCWLQGQFHLNGMHKGGDVILGGLFEIHFFSVFPDLSYTSEPKEPVCHG